MTQSSPAFSVRVEHPSAVQAVVSVAGDLDLGSSSTLSPALLDAVAYSIAVLDLTACGFCDSSGLRVILLASRQAKSVGTSLRIAGVGATVKRVMELAGAESYLNLFPDVERALSA